MSRFDQQQRGQPGKDDQHGWGGERMTLVDTLLEKITIDSLREALQKQVAQLLSKQSFGLVFQQYKPETVELGKIDGVGVKEPFESLAGAYS